MKTLLMSCLFLLSAIAQAQRNLPARFNLQKTSPKTWTGKWGNLSKLSGNKWFGWTQDSITGIKTWYEGSQSSNPDANLAPLELPVMPTMDEVEFVPTIEEPLSNQNVAPGRKTIKTLYVVDFGTIQKQGGETAMMNHLTALHQNKVEMNREILDINIDPTFNTFFYKNAKNKIDSLWTSPNVNASSRTSLVLSQSGVESWFNNGNYNGDRVHIINTTFNGGGIAFVGSLNNKAGRVAVSCIYSSAISPNWRRLMNGTNFSQLWHSVVVLHEEGHNDGSRHTHRCGEWKNHEGKFAPIDSCRSENCNPFSPARGGSQTFVMGYGQNCGGVVPDHGNKVRIKIQNTWNQATTISGTYLGAPSLFVDSLQNKDNRFILKTEVLANSLGSICRIFENGVQIRAFNVGSAAINRADTIIKSGSNRYRAQLEGIGQIHRSDSFTVRSGASGPVPCVYTYSTWSSCINGVQTRTALSSPAGCVGTPVLSQACSTATVPVSNQVCYVANGKWRLKFNIPVGSTSSHAINLCRYGQNCNLANTVLPTCGGRGTYTPTASESQAGLIDRELNPQPIPPSAGSWCYRASITIQGQVFWTPYFVFVR
jgi:hypothetical protein